MPSDDTPFSDVPVEIVVSVGRARPTIRDLLGLQADAVLTLDKGIEDPVDLLIGDRVIAHGVLEEAGDGDTRHLAVRPTSVPGLPDGD